MNPAPLNTVPRDAFVSHVICDTCQRTHHPRWHDPVWQDRMWAAINLAKAAGNAADFDALRVAMYNA